MTAKMEEMMVNGRDGGWKVQMEIGGKGHRPRLPQLASLLPDWAAIQSRDFP
jgi:hypothetical protein